MRRYFRARQNRDFWRQEAREEKYVLESEDVEDWDFDYENYEALHDWDVWRSERDKLFNCHWCDQPVIYLYGPGRWHEFLQNSWYRLPNDIPIATCVECGERYLTTAEAEAIEILARNARKAPGL